MDKVENIGGRIRYLRQSMGMTQAELAEKLGVTPATVSKYELNTREPNLKTLRLLTEILHISADELIKDYRGIDSIKKEIKYMRNVVESVEKLRPKDPMLKIYKESLENLKEKADNLKQKGEDI